MPLTQLGSWLSGLGVSPRNPLWPRPDQSLIVWPLPSASGHQARRGKSDAVVAEATPGSARAAATTAAGASVLLRRLRRLMRQPSRAVSFDTTGQWSSQGLDLKRRSNPR